jgi:hypothetical protein
VERVDRVDLDDVRDVTLVVQLKDCAGSMKVDSTDKVHYM